MQIYSLSAGGIETRHADELATLLTQPDGFVWMDCAAGEPRMAEVLSTVFHFHPLAIRDCEERCLLPKIHAYPGHVFMILHGPDRGQAGHVHLLELDQFIARNYLVTVHGPLGVGVPLEAAMQETHAVWERIVAGRFCPASPFELSYAIVSSLTRRMEAVVGGMAREVAVFERRIMQGQIHDPEQTLEQVFRLRHELLTIRTMAAQSREIMGRTTTLAARVVPVEGRPLVGDLLDQFDRVRSLCDGEMGFLQGAIDYYDIRTTTKMNQAMERLTLLSALLLPITAIASLYGMNILVFEHTNVFHLILVFTLITVMMLTLIQWAKRQGWW